MADGLERTWGLSDRGRSRRTVPHFGDNWRNRFNEIEGMSDWQHPSPAKLGNRRSQPMERETRRFSQTTTRDERHRHYRDAPFLPALLVVGGLIGRCISDTNAGVVGAVTGTIVGLVQDLLGGPRGMVFGLLVGALIAILLGAMVFIV
jgi:hypothetical protein